MGPLQPLINPTPLKTAQGPHCLLPEKHRPTFTPGFQPGPEQWTARVPNDVVDAILQPGSCLIVGDAPGDPDCFCSAIGLARMRQHLGLEAKAHVAAQPPQQIHELVRDGELVEPALVQPETVIVVDNDGTRVGPAALEAMRKAKRVVIIDHHSTHPMREKLDLPEEVELIVWSDQKADAAALMVLASAIQAVDRSGQELSEEAWADISLAFIAAVYSDTRGFDASRTRPSTLSLLKQLVDTKSIDLSKLSGFGGGIAPEIRDWLYAQITESSSKYGDQKLAVFTLDAATMHEAWSRAREDTPELTWSDILFSVLDYFEAKTRIDDVDVALFAVGAQEEAAAGQLTEAQRAQVPGGAVKFSVRTKSGPLAPNLSIHLGGGGKPHEGGGVTNESVAVVKKKAEAWMTNQQKLNKFVSTMNLTTA